MESKSFESLENYINRTTINQKSLLESDALLEGDGVFGNIIDKALSFIPRAARFKKAQKLMRTALFRYKRQASRLVLKFIKIGERKIDYIIDRYEKLKLEKIKPLIEDDNREEAAKITQMFLKEIEQYQQEQKTQLSEAINRVYEKYDSAITKRIESPGFILNVELSEKGKMDLSSKWEELAASKNMEIDEFRTKNMLENEKFKELDGIISEADTFVRENSNHIEASVRIAAIFIDKNMVGITSVPEGKMKVREKGIILSSIRDFNQSHLGKSNYQEIPLEGETGGQTKQQSTSSQWYQYIQGVEPKPKNFKNKFVTSYIKLSDNKNTLLSETQDIETALIKRLGHSGGKGSKPTKKIVNICKKAGEVTEGTICYLNNTTHGEKTLECRMNASKDLAWFDTKTDKQTLENGNTNIKVNGGN